MIPCIHGIGLKITTFEVENEIHQKVEKLQLAWGMCGGRGYF